MVIGFFTHVESCSEQKKTISKLDASFKKLKKKTQLIVSNFTAMIGSMELYVDQLIQSAVKEEMKTMTQLSMRKLN